LVITCAFATRLSISVAAQRIQTEFAFTNIQIGSILSAFVIGYGACQIPIGIIVDRVGPRILLSVAVFFWSGFTLLTPLAPRWGTPSAALSLFIMIRVLMGMAQAAALPCGNKFVARWMPLAERAAGNSVFMIGIGLGGLLSPPLVVHLMLRFGWPAPFYVLGVAGMLISGAWLLYARDDPEQHRSVSGSELRLISSGRRETGGNASRTPWSRILRSPGIWFLALSYGVAGFPSYVFYTWFFLYLANVRKVDLVSGGYWTALPYVAMALLTPAGGRLSDLLTVRHGKRWGRLTVVWVGSSLATALILAGARIDRAEAAIVCLALAAGFHLFSQPPSWAATIDLAPEHSATVFGLMNTFAQAIGAAAPVVTPWIAGRFGWIRALDATAAMAFAAGCLWFFVHPERPVE
jgi:ACS family glucarate transporter-like MFS transporter